MVNKKDKILKRMSKEALMQHLWIARDTLRLVQERNQELINKNTKLKVQNNELASGLAKYRYFVELERNILLNTIRKLRVEKRLKKAKNKKIKRIKKRKKSKRKK